jgi:thiol-disulfide isomerase/thioredoxin
MPTVAAASRRRSYACFAAALLFGVCLVSSRASAADQDTTSLKGKPAPDISLKTTDDKDFKLSELKGDVVVLDFWATWCPPCRKSLPHLNKVANNKELAEKGLKVFAVNSQETKAEAKDFASKNNYTFTMPLDAKGDAGKSYLVVGIPTTVIVGRDGSIKDVFIGFGGEESEKQLDAAIENALKDPKPQK